MKKMFFLLLLAVTVMACNRPATPAAECDCDLKIEHAKAQQMVEVQKQITDLRLDTATKAAEIACLKSKLKAAEIQDCKEVKPAPPAPKPVKAKATSKKATPVAVKSVPVATPTPTPAPVQAPVAVKAAPVAAPTLRATDVSVFESLADPDGKLRLTVRVNGREDHWFPDYVIRKGTKIFNAEDNGLQGNNLVVLQATDGYTNPEGGVTNTGVIYYPATQIKKYIKNIDYVDVVFSKNWTPVRMTSSGDWYIYETR